MKLLAALAVGAFCALVAGAIGGVLPRRAVPTRGTSARTERARLWLQQSGAGVSPTQFVLASAGAGFVALMVVTALTGSLFVAVVPAITVALLPRAYYGHRRTTRMRAVLAAWPDGLRDLLASISAGHSLSQAVTALSLHGPPTLRAAFARFPDLARVLGTGAALEIVKEELADATSDRILEVLILAHERGGAIVRTILEDLVDATTKDLKLLEELETEGLEMRINARVVVVLPWLVLVALTARPGAFRAFYQSGGGVVTLLLGAGLSAIGVVVLGRLGREPDEPRVFPQQSERGVTGLAAIAAIGVGLGVAACTGLIVPPTARLRPRVRPYTLVARTALGYAPDVLDTGRVSTPTGVFGRLFLPPLQALARRKPTGDGGEPGDERLQRLLMQSGAGADAVTVQDFRIRQIGTGVTAAVIGGVATALLVRSPVAGFVVVLAAYTVGATRSRKRLEREVLERARRIRQELYTVNHLLAMHVRTGSGPIQAVQRIVDRGRGAVVEDFAALLAAIRHGSNEAEAFRRAADLTPEPSAARAYQLLAASSERGSDLGVALLALSEDIRDARREQLHKDAVRRRAAMLVPTIAILAPIMLLFIAAPLPSIVLGYR